MFLSIFSTFSQFSISKIALTLSLDGTFAEKFIFLLSTRGDFEKCQTDRRHFCVYNVAIHTGELQAATFKHALHSFPLEWFIGLLCAFFIASKTSKYFAFRVAKSTDRPIFIILCIQTFTVCTMVPLMSLLGIIESSGITSNLIFIWLQTICLNFIMAYPLQILVVGPFCRFIFRHLFASTNQGNESKVEYEMEQQGFAE